MNLDLWLQPIARWGQGESEVQTGNPFSWQVASFY